MDGIKVIDRGVGLYEANTVFQHCWIGMRQVDNVWMIDRLASDYKDMLQFPEYLTAIFHIKWKNKPQ